MMVKMSHVKKTNITAVCIALCVVLPMAFHTIPGAGGIFMPMHIPVLLCGLICGWPFGLLCGVAGPLLSSLLTGMPQAVHIPAMLVELVSYGMITGIMMRLINTRKLYADLYISLVAAMLVGRVVAGISRALIFAPGDYSVAIWATSFFVRSLPGMALQLAILPTIVVALETARVLPRKYPKAG